VRSYAILEVQTGSRLIGCELNSSDNDAMAILVEPFADVMAFSPFKNDVYRDAEVRTGDPHAKSQPGELDLSMYGLREYLRLVLKGNPTLTELLFVPKEMCSVYKAGARLIQDMATKMVSQRTLRAYLGYMANQRERLLGERGQKRTNRPELVEAYGYDTKYAYHVLRLGCQGNQLAAKGRLEFPLEGHVRASLLSVRKGEVCLNDAVEWMTELERLLEIKLKASELPAEPDYVRVEKMMQDIYWESWL
jgi:predicted nucleotidyltransferase